MLSKDRTEEMRWIDLHIFRVQSFLLVGKKSSRIPDTHNGADGYICCRVFLYVPGCNCTRIACRICDIWPSLVSWNERQLENYGTSDATVTSTGLGHVPLVASRQQVSAVL